VDFAVKAGDDDHALLLAKRSLERQIRRLTKVDASTGLGETGKDGFTVDLYFQQFCGSKAHASLESVLR
jgi:hypothetical protein